MEQHATAKSIEMQIDNFLEQFKRSASKAMDGDWTGGATTTIATTSTHSFGSSNSSTTTTATVTPNTAAAASTAHTDPSLSTTSSTSSSADASSAATTATIDATSVTSSVVDSMAHQWHNQMLQQPQQLDQQQQPQQQSSHQHHADNGSTSGMASVSEIARVRGAVNGGGASNTEENAHEPSGIYKIRPKQKIDILFCVRYQCARVLSHARCACVSVTQIVTPRYVCENLILCIISLAHITHIWEHDE